MTINIPDRLCSRKLWVTVIAIAIVEAPLLGIDVSAMAQQLTTGLGAAYVVAQGLVDALAAKQPNMVMLPTPPSDHISL